MDLSKLVLNSFKYPFRNIKKLPVLCLLFVFIGIIPIGMISNNNYITAIGAIAFFLFILLVPGYFISMIKLGSNQSAMLPSFNLVNNIYDSIRVLFFENSLYAGSCCFIFDCINGIWPCKQKFN
ncbi:hypothetical protein [uncultured Methanobrevibacter sp.]|uniref:hypothetical protein n=1 Tax=uncultured Methanobrevibacter sp. TaxID=253161 RepID=UPI0025FBAB26|nr:hypothetical protein [uncultured Methanobrevibacter sp.]